jgi:uracil phosphoribosyltransferase
MSDLHNLELRRDAPEMEHRYGDRIHILSHPVARTLLARLGQARTRQPQLNQLVLRLYDVLFDAAVGSQFPAESASRASRSENYLQTAGLEGEFLGEGTRVAIAGIARAGTLPAHRCFERLCDILDPDGVRIDHLFMSRRVSATGEVVGIDCRGTKIGGTLDDRFLVVTDPLAGTGATMRYALNLYSKEVGGTPRGILALHLVVTPEYIRALTERHPDVIVYALRVDRGLSTEAALEEIPGTLPEQERGLDAHQYIVPGLGALGELMNHSFV